MCQNVKKADYEPMRVTKMTKFTSKTRILTFGKETAIGCISVGCGFSCRIEYKYLNHNTTWLNPI